MLSSTENNNEVQKEQKVIGALAEKVWDAKTQQYHGGQEWKFLNNFVEDFSVTTNGLGTPQIALQAAKDAVSTLYIMILITIIIIKKKRYNIEIYKSIIVVYIAFFVHCFFYVKYITYICFFFKKKKKTCVGRLNILGKNKNNRKSLYNKSLKYNIHR